MIDSSIHTRGGRLPCVRLRGLGNAERNEADEAPALGVTARQTAVDTSCSYGSPRGGPRECRVERQAGRSPLKRTSSELVSFSMWPLFGPQSPRCSRTFGPARGDPNQPSAPGGAPPSRAGGGAHVLTTVDAKALSFSGSLRSRGPRGKLSSPRAEAAFSSPRSPGPDRCPRRDECMS